MKISEPLYDAISIHCEYVVFCTCFIYYLHIQWQLKEDTI
jgi:hypothetical protein